MEHRNEEKTLLFDIYIGVGLFIIVLSSSNYLKPEKLINDIERMPFGRLSYFTNLSLYITIVSILLKHSFLMRVSGSINITVSILYWSFNILYEFKLLKYSATNFIQYFFAISEHIIPTFLSIYIYERKKVKRYKKLSYCFIFYLIFVISYSGILGLNIHKGIITYIIFKGKSLLQSLLIIYALAPLLFLVDYLTFQILFNKIRK